MRIAFVDRGGWGYTTDAPLRAPMGGTESALCYLARELALLGHDVTLFNGLMPPVKDPLTAVISVCIDSLDAVTRKRLQAFDAVIVKSLACGRAMRAIYAGRLILWTQCDIDQEAVRPLLSRNEQMAWDDFVFVSDWQLRRYKGYYGVPAEKCWVLKNCPAPPFLNEPVARPRPGPPVLYYASTPYRGLEHLLRVFPRVRAGTGADLHVFSSMAPYRWADDPFGPLYDLARSMEGVSYHGSLGQVDLARTLHDLAPCALAYPCTFAETSCIAALEAMALGCDVFGTDIGALPETTGNAALPHLNDWADRVIDDLSTRALRRVGRRPTSGAWPDRARAWQCLLSNELAGAAQ